MQPPINPKPTLSPNDIERAIIVCNHFWRKWKNLDEKRQRTITRIFGLFIIGFGSGVVISTY